MPKFSIIIPVYNTEKYLKKCLDSVFNQKYKDFEVIVVNDGSTDNSMDVIENYKKKYSNIVCIFKENGGLSSARNVGVSKAKGKYILFLDSDDYYSDNFLETLNDETNDEDIVRYQVRDVFSNGKTIEYFEKPFNDLDGIKAFDLIVRYHYVEIACAYCFKKGFWIKNKFKFKENTYHEDFGLIPLVLIKSKKTKSINYIGYNYFQRDGSIMTSKDYCKILKKANDFLEHFKYMINDVNGDNRDLSIFKSYIANSVILKSTSLKDNDYKKYVFELKKIGAFDMILDDSISRKVKKILIKISPKIYYKVVK